MRGVSVEIGEGVLTRRVRITAPSIELARQPQYNPGRRLRRRFVSERCRRDTCWQRIGYARRNML